MSPIKYHVVFDNDPQKLLTTTTNSNLILQSTNVEFIDYMPKKLCKNSSESLIINQSQLKCSQSVNNTINSCDSNDDSDISKGRQENRLTEYLITETHPLNQKLKNILNDFNRSYDDQFSSDKLNHSSNILWTLFEYFKNFDIFVCLLIDLKNKMNVNIKRNKSGEPSTIPIETDAKKSKGVESESLLDSPTTSGLTKCKRQPSIIKANDNGRLLLKERPEDIVEKDNCNYLNLISVWYD